MANAQVFQQGRALHGLQETPAVLTAFTDIQVSSLLTGDTLVGNGLPVGETLAKHKRMRCKLYQELGCESSSL